MPNEFATGYPDYRIASDGHGTFTVVHDSTNENVSHHTDLGEARASAREYQRLDNMRRIKATAT